VAAELRARGTRIEVVRRDRREGFKAGALKHGMEIHPAPYYAIFDADFVPPADFLRRTLPIMMQREDVGLVQARWGHLNPDASMVTRGQALGIDGHFGIEQGARAWNRLFMNFNGTAGLWRRRAIEDAGGWQADTLTEDMDLSYRSQLQGWKPYYLSDLVVPAEVPEDINAFKSQQFRWAKGSIQTAIKLIPRVMRSPCSGFAKVQAVFHMTHYLIHPIMVWLALFAMPLMLIHRMVIPPGWVGLFLGLILTSALAPFVLYTAAQFSLHDRGGRRLKYLPLLSALGVGIAVSNAQAVYEAVVGKSSPFVRTPKRGDRTTVGYRVRMPGVAVIELLLGLYCWFSLLIFLTHDTWVIGPFLVLYATGFTLVGCLSVLHSLSDPGASPASSPATTVPSAAGSL
jgi:hypothetical protein